MSTVFLYFGGISLGMAFVTFATGDKEGRGVGTIFAAVSALAHLIAAGLLV